MHRYKWLSAIPQRRGWWVVGFTALLAFLHFDPKVSIGGDDSAYIYRTLLFLKKGQFPSFQGPLYPLILTPFVALFGLNLMVLKALSMVFTVGASGLTWLTLIAHKERRFAWLAVLLIFITNYSILTFASLTYSEALYMLLQALLFAWAARFVRLSPAKDWRSATGRLLPLAALNVFMFLARNIGLASLVASVLWLAFSRRLREALLLMGLVTAIYAPFHGIKSIIFKEKSAQISEQGKGLLLKDSYKPELGTEDAAGFFNRFLDNSVLYLSKRTLQMLGFLPETSTRKFPFLATIVWLIILGAIGVHLKNKDPLSSFVGIYVAVFCGLTFIVLQTRWDQERLIMVVVPYIVFLLFSLGQWISETKRLPLVRPLMTLILGILLLVNVGRTLSHMDKHITLLRKTFSGDLLYGFTPDLVNFIRMSQYAAKNVPESATIVSRKPTISSIYAGGREFEGMYVSPPADPDSCLNWFRKRKAEYVIDARLRQNPYKFTGQYITTITFALYYIQTKYPERIRLLHQIGQSEEAYLYQLDIRE